MKLLAALFVFGFAAAGTSFAQDSVPSAVAEHSPAVAASLNRIEAILETESTLEPPLRALLGLIAAREMDLPHEWRAHHRAALAAGLNSAAVEAVRLGRPAEELSSADALVVDFGRQLFRGRHVSSTTFAALVRERGRRGAFEVIMGLTYPMLTGTLQRALWPQPPDGWDPATLPPILDAGTPHGRPGEFAALPPRPPLPADVHEDSYYRFPLLRRDELDVRGREIFDRFVGADRATTPRGPVGMTFLSPELVEPVQQLNTALRVEGALDTRAAEIVIAAPGREMNSQYQWTVHGAAAAQAGAGEVVLDAIRLDGELASLDARDAAAIAFTRELFREPRVRPATYAAAADLFGTRGAVEIAALVGDYLMMTTVYNALGMRLRPDQAATLPHRVGAPIGAEWR